MCIVFTEKDKQVDISISENADSFLFHRFDLKEPENACNRMSQIATTGKCVFTMDFG